MNCLKNFFIKNTKICNKQLFSSFKEQYKKADYIILAESLTKNYINPEFIDTVKYLRNDKKKFIIFFDDLTGADILDIFIHRMERLPNPNELLNLEKVFLQKSNSYRKKLL